jgi:ketosteroid isomerase-like protein
MPEKSTTPDLVELVRQSFEAGNSREFAAIMSIYAPDAVWDMSSAGLGMFEGEAAIRSFLEDWIGSYEEYENKLEENRDLGKGVVFAVAHLDGRPVGSPSTVQERWAFTAVWVAGTIVRVVATQDIDEARAAAERLAQERADG